jgi:hypothetical protein
MVLTLCYDAISRNVGDAGFNPFVLFSISSATILPSCVVILLLQDRIGRKAMTSISLFLTGLFIGATGVLLATQGDHSSTFSSNWRYCVKLTVAQQLDNFSASCGT